MGSLEEWAKKAREELSNHCTVVAGSEEFGYPEDFNDEVVIALCDEYDKIMETRRNAPMINIDQSDNVVHTVVIFKERE